MIYTNYHRNHVIIPGREQALHQFLNATIVCNGKEEKHKLRYAKSSNSEDALTWSCFEVLRNQPKAKMVVALDELFEDVLVISKRKTNRCLRPFLLLMSKILKYT